MLRTSLIIFLFFFNYQVISQSIGVKIEYNYLDNLVNNGMRLTPFYNYVFPSQKFELDINFEFSYFWYRRVNDFGMIQTIESGGYGSFGFGGDFYYRLVTFKNDHYLLGGMGSKLLIFYQVDGFALFDLESTPRIELRLPLLYCINQIGDSNVGLRLGVLPGYMFASINQSNAAGIDNKTFFFGIQAGLLFHL